METIINIWLSIWLYVMAAIAVVLGGKFTNTAKHGIGSMCFVPLPLSFWCCTCWRNGSFPADCIIRTTSTTALPF